jgi:rhamnulokinase
MTSTKNILAFDLGAESGRAVLGRFDGSRLTLDVIHRFSNRPVHTLDSVHWDVLGLYGEMLIALRKGAAEPGGIASLGVDTWGVDFALLGRDGSLLGNPRHYRDPHTEGIMEEVFRQVPREKIFQQTGVQFLRFNTLFQLAAMKRDRSPLLDAAHNLLFMPDLFHYWFTGIKVNEFTDASTSQMLDAVSKSWAYGLLKAVGISERLPGSLVAPGTVLGPLRSAICSDTSVGAVEVIAPATHDTACAVAAVPATGDSWAYISSGTWSLMGAELPQAIIDEKALEHNFTNEGGVAGTTRLLKNIMGLWLVQECRRAWERKGRSFTYEELTRLAEQSPGRQSMIDPDAEAFWLPPDMPAAIAEFCRRSGQKAPSGEGAIVRCALDSLASKYQWVLERMEELIDRRLEVIHVVGGGSQNGLLCQLTADACKRPVLAGPVEATAIGNILVQAMGLGLLSSLADAREVVRRSFEVQLYSPRN